MLVCDLLPATGATGIALSMALFNIAHFETRATRQFKLLRATTPSNLLTWAHSDLMAPLAYRLILRMLLAPEPLGFVGPVKVPAEPLALLRPKPADELPAAPGTPAGAPTAPPDGPPAPPPCPNATVAIPVNNTATKMPMHLNCMMWLG